MHAVRAQNYEIVLLLLEHGADPMLKNNKKKDAVVLANRHPTIRGAIHERIQYRQCLKF